ncbi:hypothetical protein, partial [Bacillus altitudinis]
MPNNHFTLPHHPIPPSHPQTSQYYPQLLHAVSTHYPIDMDIPVKD